MYNGTNDACCACPAGTFQPMKNPRNQTCINCTSTSDKMTFTRKNGRPSDTFCERKYSPPTVDVPNVNDL